MKFSLPSSPSKHYLTGMDWMIHALDYSSRKQTGCGTSFQIVVELSSPLESSDLERNLSNYCACFPHLTGKVSRDFNLAPYWKYLPSQGFFKLKRLTALNFDEALMHLEAELNQSSQEKAIPLRAVYVETPQKSVIGFIFDHRFFDARGGERFLQGFQNYYLSPEKPAEIKLPPAPAHLDCWAKQFSAGKKMNRARIAQEKSWDKESKIQSLRSPASFKGTTNRFKVKTFSEEETRVISERAGPFMFLPYMLGACFRAVQALFLKRNKEEGGLTASVTRDMRQAHGETVSETFFNHLSFMFFAAGADEIADENLLQMSLKNQFYEQIKNKIPEALGDASMLMRILPLSLMSGILESTKNVPVSFSLASLGESAYPSENFMGANVERMFHMPRMPLLPGLGIFFSQYKKRLSVTISYFDHLINEDEAVGIMNKLSEQ